MVRSRSFCGDPHHLLRRRVRDLQDMSLFSVPRHTRPRCWPWAAVIVVPMHCGPQAALKTGRHYALENPGPRPIVLTCCAGGMSWICAPHPTLWWRTKGVAAGQRYVCHITLLSDRSPALDVSIQAASPGSNGPARLARHRVRTSHGSQEHYGWLLRPHLGR
ncbi:hypothetical protein C8R45DRAFT_159075 [Mycena sanguinolenta]|nr:hypothetical protein C8R45DRAFT_159075 [Mycena sanguinolenta]